MNSVIYKKYSRYENYKVIMVYMHDGATKLPFLIKTDDYKNLSSSSRTKNEVIQEQQFWWIENQRSSDERVDGIQSINIEVKRHLAVMYLIKDDAECLSYAFNLIEQSFNKRDLRTVDALLYNFEPKKSKTIISTGILRCSFRARNLLSNWRLCAGRVASHLTSRNENTQHLLRGLIRENDCITYSTTTLS